MNICLLLGALDKFINYIHVDEKNVIQFDQDMVQSHIADQPMAQ